MIHRNAVLTLAGLKLALHLATIQGYGYFRDELYYLACSRRLDWGYVDHPPLSVFFLSIVRPLLGESLFALRLVPAIVGALIIAAVGWMAAKLGGGRDAQVIAMVAALVAPNYLGVCHIWSMNVFDVFLWALSAAVLIRILDGGDERLWLLLGAVLGLGLLNKVSFLWLGTGLAVGLLLTRERRWLATRWPWLAGGIAALVFAPYLVWQVLHGWPTLEFIANATGRKMSPVSPADFLVGQIESMHPLNLPIWLAGLAFFFFLDSGRRFRLLGWVYVTVFAILVLSGTSRAGYLSPAYTFLLAAGGVAVERAVRGKWPRRAIVALLLATGAALAPFALPLLPVETYIRYAERLGVAPSTAERKEIGDLPQWYADMHGWRQIVATVAEVYDSLPAEERRDVRIVAPDYGVAGAVDLFGRELGLPPAISAHNNYWLWGPGGGEPGTMIVVNASESEVAPLFASCEQAATTDCGYCMPYENGRPVWVCRGLRIPIAEVWAAVKNFD